MTEHYFLDPLAPFPRRWMDKGGNIEVMTGPVKGYVMVRRPYAVPFVLRVSDLCNATKDPHHGPFELVGVKTRRARVSSPPDHA
jgi:hypothetical protein